jgi:serine/threonine protein kinase
MSVVYSATDTTCERHVALDILRPSVASRRALSTQQLQREASTAVGVRERTPHLVDVLTAGITDDAHRLPYIVMERLHGTSLRESILAKDKLRPSCMPQLNRGKLLNERTRCPSLSARPYASLCRT